MHNPTRPLRRVLLGGAALTALLVTAGCGAEHTSGGHAGSAQPTSAPASQPGGTSNSADVHFAQMMIPHHRQALEMADLAASRAEDAELKSLAAAIRAAQDPEIEILTGWLTDWRRPTVAPGTGHGHGDHSGMPGMMTDQDMAALREVTGVAFDRMFAGMMIVHHEGAVQMAKDQQRHGADEKVKALARQIETSQADEIEQLRAILARL